MTHGNQSSFAGAIDRRKLEPERKPRLPGDREQVVVRRGGRASPTGAIHRPECGTSSSGVFARTCGGGFSTSETPELELASPELLFEGRFQSGVYFGNPGLNYDVSPHGRFIMIQEEGSHAEMSFHVVLDWFDEPAQNRFPILEVLTAELPQAGQDTLFAVDVKPTGQVNGGGTEPVGIAQLDVLGVDEQGEQVGIERAGVSQLELLDELVANGFEFVLGDR
jgi:hypothetical protein